MSDDAGTPSPKPTGSVVLDNRQVYKLLVSKINEQVDKGFRKRLESLRSWFLLIVVVLPVFITAGGAFIVKSYVDDAVDDAVASAVERAVPITIENAVLPALKEAEDTTRFDLEVGNLNLRMLNLDLSDGFTNEEANSIIAEIRSLISKSKGDEKRLPKLANAIETAVLNFVAAGRVDLAFRIEEVTPDPLFNNSGVITSTILQEIGFTLIADAGAPESWQDTTGSRNEIHKKYRIYANRAGVGDYPGLYLLYEVLLGYIEGRSAETIENLIEDIDGLDMEDANFFVDVMESLAKDERRTAESKRAAHRVTEFLCEYGGQSTVLPMVSERAAIQC